MESYEFLIDERPFFIWDWDLRAKNRRFLTGIDPRYFRHLAQLNASVLEDQRDHYAALSIRLTYSHALESFCALAGASIQAPACPLGWLLQYKNTDLYAVIRKVSHRRPLATRLDRSPTWASLAETVVLPANIDEGLKPELIQNLTMLWARFGNDFLDRPQQDEYNSLKHGFRVTPGGFVLRVGVEPSYGVSPPESEMQTVGASEYGSSFYIIERPVGGRVDFRPRNFSRNWHPEDLLYAIDLLVLSMTNLLAFLRTCAGEDASKVTFEMLEDPSGFHLPWRHHSGVTSLNLDTDIGPADIVPSDSSAILGRLNSQ